MTAGIFREAPLPRASHHSAVLLHIQPEPGSGPAQRHPLPSDRQETSSDSGVAGLLRRLSGCVIRSAQRRDSAEAKISPVSALVTVKREAPAFRIAEKVHLPNLSPRSLLTAFRSGIYFSSGTKGLPPK